MQSLMAHALIDELKLMIDPLTVGGKRLCHDDGALGNPGDGARQPAFLCASTRPRRDAPGSELSTLGRAGAPRWPEQFWASQEASHYSPS